MRRACGPPQDTVNRVEGSGAAALYMEQNRNKTRAIDVERVPTMLKQAFLTGLIELTAFGLLSGAVGLWAVALAPIR